MNFRQRKSGMAPQDSSQQKQRDFGILTRKGLATGPSAAVEKEDDHATHRAHSGRQISETALANAVLAFGIAPKNEHEEVPPTRLVSVPFRQRSSALRTVAHRPAETGIWSQSPSQKKADSHPG